MFDIDQLCNNPTDDNIIIPVEPEPEYPPERRHRNEQENLDKINGEHFKLVTHPQLYDYKNVHFAFTHIV